MRRDHDYQPNPERLPDHFGPALRATDDQVADLARIVMDRSRDGLSDRVYEASVGDLPSRTVPARATTRPEWRPRLAGSVRDWRVVTGAWGRLGLAAALGFAFILAGTLMDGSPDVSTTATDLAAVDIGWLDEDPLEMVDARVGHILDSGALSSHAEVADEIASMIASLEM